MDDHHLSLHHKIEKRKKIEKKGKKKQGLCHIVAALPFTLKKYLKAKEELGNLKYFTMQKYNLQ
jgi:hypothetical protein